jgi:GntR family transcriptional regulator
MRSLIKGETTTSLALPLYHQVASILRQRINDGTYAEGERVLSEGDLATEFGVSRATVRQAMGELAQAGLIVRKQGSGTFVSKANDERIQQRFRGSLGALIDESGRAKMRDVELHHDCILNPHVASVLQLEDSKRGTIVRRTRVMDGLPFAYTVNYLRPEVGQLLTVSGLRKAALLVLLIRQGVRLSHATQSIRAELADLEACTRLGVEAGSAVLYVERTVYDTDAVPIQIVRSWYRGDRYEYTVSLEMDARSEETVYSNLA